MKIKTLSGASNFVTFIDDASRKVQVYALKTKNQVFETFKQFHTQFKRETGKLLKSIGTKNGDEYRGPFEECCRKHDILNENIVPKTPQHNGVAKRINRTIIEKVRYML